MTNSLFSTGVLTPEEFMTKNQGERIDIMLSKLAAETNSGLKELGLAFAWQQRQIAELYRIIGAMKKEEGV